MNKYYFITYQERYSKTAWNKVIDVSPMEFIKAIELADQEFGDREFVVTNTLEISEDEFNEFRDSF